MKLNKGLPVFALFSANAECNRNIQIGIAVDFFKSL